LDSFAHLAAGFLAAFIAALAISSFQAQNALALFSNANVVAVVALASLAPDLDHRKSRVFKTALLVAFLASAVLVYNAMGFVGEIVVRAAVSVAAGLVVCSAIYVLKPRHRGVTHSALASLVFAAVVFVVLQSKSLALFAFVAYASHLLADGEIKFK
jgi:membrane-bound metal-dependent hydrolase YbcI (DUF457 family)